MKKFILLLVLLLLTLTFAGCEQQTNFNLSDQIEFIPESGASQYVMCSAMSQAVDSFNFERYRKKSVYIEIANGTPFSQTITLEFISSHLIAVKAKILSHLTDEQQKQGLRGPRSDYNLNFTILTCGIHSYDGLIRKKIVGLAMLNLDEINNSRINGETINYSGQLHQYTYKPWVFSTYFIVFLLTLILLVIGALLRFLLFRKFKLKKRAQKG